MSGHASGIVSDSTLIPAFETGGRLTGKPIGVRFAEACAAWLAKSPSMETRCDLHPASCENSWTSRNPPPRTPEPNFAAIHRRTWPHFATSCVSVGSAIRRLSARSRCSAPSSPISRCTATWGRTRRRADFVSVPPVPHDGKTVGLSPEDCRRMLDAPRIDSPEGVRERALFAVLAYTGCRVGELVRPGLHVEGSEATGTHRVLEVRGKGGKGGTVPLHPEAVERLETWLDAGGIAQTATGHSSGPRDRRTGRGKDGFQPRAMTRRAVQHLIYMWVRRVGAGPSRDRPFLPRDGVDDGKGTGIGYN